MELYKMIEEALCASSPEEKEACLEALGKSDGKAEDGELPIMPLLHPSYASFCTIVPPKSLPSRKKLGSDEGKIALIHAIAHIEYSAIDLALDAAYRFRGLPNDFVQEWLTVAQEEMHHFKTLRALLVSLGTDYGALPVHNTLFDAALKTRDSLRLRMAVVPRYLEANGLDSNLLIMQKLYTQGDTISRELLSALEVILKEEVGHVARGDRWFTHACVQDGVQKSCYFDLVRQVFPHAFGSKSKPLNIEARLQAGFEAWEIQAHQKGCEGA